MSHEPIARRVFLTGSAALALSLLGCSKKPLECSGEAELPESARNARKSAGYIARPIRSALERSASNGKRWALIAAVAASYFAVPFIPMALAGFLLEQIERIPARRKRVKLFRCLG